ncbi:MAG: serine/threonine protein kinase [Planctomycetes bacterium]|nr:serine/threonine protein kinase [Planctomycetota bacterium]
MLASGTRFGPYTIDRLVGQGSSGIVYRASSPTHGIVALKVLAPQFAADPLLFKMFEEGSRAGLAIEHQNIVKTVDVGNQNGVHYIAFEFINGIPLSDVIRKAGMLTEGQCVWVLRQIGQALRKLRQSNIVHQDVKPENILVDANGDCKLADLGFARVPASRIEWSNLTAGTPIYMSPEQARPGNSAVDHRSDLYSLGATIFHAATGFPPFRSKEEVELQRMHLEERPPAANAKNPALSMEFAKVVAKLLEKDPAERFQNAEDLLLAIRSVPATPAPPAVVVSRVTAHGT